MDGRDPPAQRPVTLDVTVDATNEAPSSDVSEPSSSHAPSRDSVLPQVDSIDLGADFASPQEDSSATLSESLMDKLNEQMMESVMISDSPNNSEEDDVGAIDSFLDEREVVEENAGDASGDTEELTEIGQNITEIKVSVQEQHAAPEEMVKEETDTKEEEITPVSSQFDPQMSPDLQSEKLTPTNQGDLKDEPIPVCTIFSQGSQPKSLVPDGFQPTLIKSPSFSVGSSGGGDEAVTPSKLTTAPVCQPSPSLSKFFTDNGQVNPASDFFDSFMAPSSFISVSNPNAEIPAGPKPVPVASTSENQLSTTSSSLSSPGGPLDSSAPTPVSVVCPAPTECPFQPSPVPVAQPQPFNQLQAVFSGTDDAFATALSLSEVDRRHDAWLPSEDTRKLLMSVATQQCNPAYVDASRLTMPGLKFDNLQVGRCPGLLTVSSGAWF